MKKGFKLSMICSAMVFVSGLMGAASWALSPELPQATAQANVKPPVPTVFKENTNYKVVSLGQTVPGREVEVVEFFSFACPHCAHLEPTLQTWKKNLPKGVVFRRVPVVFRPQWESLAKAYYTLEVLNVGYLESEVFKAIHEEKQDLSVPSAFISWLVKHHIDEKKAKAAYESFTVITKASQAKGVAQQYQIEGVPTIIVGGKYMTDVAKAGSVEAVPSLLNHLIHLSQKK
jgi:protein dithiol oxidoreductase (disulfide-forming)